MGLYHGECVALGMLPMIESKALQKRVRAVYRLSLIHIFRRALHPAEAAVGGGGVGHTVVARTGHPAGKAFRQRVLHAALLKIVNVCRL